MAMRLDCKTSAFPVVVQFQICTTTRISV